MSAECRDIRELLAKALDGDLAGDERRTLDRHLTACSECRRAYGRLERAVAVFAAAPAPKPRPDFAATVMRRVREAQAAAARRRRVVGWALLTAAATAAGGLALTWSGVLAPAFVGLAGSLAKNVPLAAAQGGTFAKVFTRLTGPAGALLRALGETLATLAWEGLKAGSPAYLAGFAAIGACYLVWRAGRRREAPQGRAA